MASKTIIDAAEHFRTDIGKELIRAFKATGVIDLYNGDPLIYMQVIAQTLERQNEKLYTMRNAAHTLKSIIEANFS